MSVGNRESVVLLPLLVHVLDQVGVLLVQVEPLNLQCGAELPVDHAQLLGQDPELLHPGGPGVRPVVGPAHGLVQGRLQLGQVRVEQEILDRPYVPGGVAPYDPADPAAQGRCQDVSGLHRVLPRQ